MKTFLKSNPGLSSRIRYKIHFPDYTVEEMATILEKTAVTRGYTITSTDIPALISNHTTPRMRSQQNARLVRNIFEGARVCQNSRLSVDAPNNELFLINEEDLKQACLTLKGIGDEDEDDPRPADEGEDPTS